MPKDIDNPNCDQVADKVIPDAHIDANKNTIVHKFVVNRDFGNSLSRYWAARTLADLGGYNFQIPHNNIKVIIKEKKVDSFLRFLPTSIPAKPKQPEALERVLCTTSTEIEYIHEFPYGYAGPMTSTQRQDTRSALLQYAAVRYNTSRGAKEVEERHQLLGLFYQKNDWLIYERCVILGHFSHGIGTLSVYDALPTSGNYTIYTLSGRKEDLGYLCDDLHQIRNDYIQSRNPNVTIIKLEQMDRNVDFGRLANAPNLLLPTAGSTWALWAAIANPGRVVMVKFNPGHNDKSVPPSNFEVLWNATVLYNPLYQPGSGKLLGFNDSAKATTEEGKAMLFDCYRNC